MRKADFTAKVKKIEIVNRVLTNGWAQSIRVILEDIELSDENLLELKQFRPNEQVMVELCPVQVNLFDLNAPKETDDNNEEFIHFSEDEEPGPEKVKKEWHFGP
jgi:hypothetical protein